MKKKYTYYRIKAITKEALIEAVPHLKRLVHPKEFASLAVQITGIF